MRIAFRLRRADAILGVQDQFGLVVGGLAVPLDQVIAPLFLGARAVVGIPGIGAAA